MTRLLANLLTVPGVRGAAVYDHQGACLEHRLEAPLEPSAVGEVLEGLLVGLEAYEHLERAPFRFAMARHGQGVVGIVRTLSHRAIALATSAVNPSLLTVAFGALEVKLGRLNNASVPGALNPNLSWPPASIDSTEVESLPPGDLVSGLTMQTTLDALAERLGPMARLLVREHLTAMGLPPASVPRTLWPQLVENLAREIPDEHERRTFVQQTLDLV